MGVLTDLSSDLCSAFHKCCDLAVVGVGGGEDLNFLSFSSLICKMRILSKHLLELSGDDRQNAKDNDSAQGRCSVNASVSIKLVLHSKKREASLQVVNFYSQVRRVENT